MAFIPGSTAFARARQLKIASPTMALAGVLKYSLSLSVEIQTQERPGAAARSWSMQGLLIIRQIAQY